MPLCEYGQILALLNEIPATSRKYQFAMAMADRILDDNSRNGHVKLLHINRTALASAFARTSTLLYCSLNLTQQQADRDGMMTSSGWPERILRSLPMGNYIASSVKGISAVIRYVGNACTASGGLTQLNGGGRQSSSHDIDGVADHLELAAEKLAQELLWITGRMRDYGAVEEALEQWSFSSALASASLEASPRVQGFIIKISALLFGELMRDHHQTAAAYSREVKVGILMLWLPLCCHASNGLSYPILTGLEKVEVERAMDQVISSLPQPDQELVLTTWFHDFTTSASDWPNLQVSYDRWCHCTRKLV
ncbi:hypothetical protein CDL15_Pgr008040 [Punica granatum]|uniref:At3g05675-like ankyrin-like domain-containing protein n=1 Tax=Punica granatum TaxID=22663 RepID=A0A218VRF7_PUNGR|nr:hypothetical protein CDL15_Pgr008040 [Punica granatum]